MPGDDFAEFMMDFDSIAGMAEMKLDSLLLERKAQAMQYTIICQTVGELGNQLLEGHHGLHRHIRECLVQTKQDQGHI